LQHRPLSGRAQACCEQQQPHSNALLQRHLRGALHASRSRAARGRAFPAAHAGRAPRRAPGSSGHPTTSCCRRWTRRSRARRGTACRRPRSRRCPATFTPRRRRRPRPRRPPPPPRVRSRRAQPRPCGRRARRRRIACRAGLSPAPARVRFCRRVLVQRGMTLSRQAWSVSQERQRGDGGANGRPCLLGARARSLSHQSSLPHMPLQARPRARPRPRAGSPRAAARRCPASHAGAWRRRPPRPGRRCAGIAARTAAAPCAACAWRTTRRAIR